MLAHLGTTTSSSQQKTWPKSPVDNYRSINAAAKSFFSIFKNDFYHHYHFDTRQQARTSTVRFIEWFDNRYRPHGHNEGALPPADAMRAKLNPVLKIVLPAAA